MTVIDTDPTPPHGVERKPLAPTVDRFDDGTVRIELGYGFEHGPNVRAAFVGTPQTIIRDYLTPLLAVAMAAAEPERDEAIDWLESPEGQRILDEEEAAVAAGTIVYENAAFNADPDRDDNRFTLAAETGDVYDIVAAAETQIPDPRPVMCFDRHTAQPLDPAELEFLHRQIDGWYSDDWTPRLLATVEALRVTT